MSRRLAIALVLTLALPALGDRLHLESGGTIDTSHWWYEDDWIYYEAEGGRMGLPRSAVLRIERSGGRERAEPSELPQARVDEQRLRDPDRERRLDGEMRRGRAALEASRYAEALDHFERVIAAEPRYAGPRVGYAIAQIRLGNDGAALNAVLDGLAHEPDAHQLHELLGDIRNREERVRDALLAWQRAYATEPSQRLRDKIAKAERELQAGDRYDFARSSHFNLRYDGDVDMTLAREVLDYLEESFYELTTELAHTPRQPITLQLFPRETFREVTNTREWVGGLFDGKIRVPLGGLGSVNEPARRVLSHELTHAILHSKTRGHCPWWLHEGLAQMMEGRRSTPQAVQQAAEALAREEKDAEVHLAYVEALALTEYLERQRGMSGLLWLLDRLGAGDSEDEAMTRVYGDDLAATRERWQRQQRAAVR